MPNDPSPSLDDCVLFVDKALDQMAAIVAELGDELANRRPDLPGANSPYQLLFHCLGVCEFWGGGQIAGRTIERDRAAEFHAAGKVGPLCARVPAAKERLRRDLAKLDPTAPTSTPLPSEWNPRGTERTFTQGEALIHVATEVSQHLGHLELTRDLLRHRA